MKYIKTEVGYYWSLYVCQHRRKVIAGNGHCRLFVVSFIANLFANNDPCSNYLACRNRAVDQLNLITDLAARKIPHCSHKLESAGNSPIQNWFNTGNSIIAKCFCYLIIFIWFFIPIGIFHLTFCNSTKSLFLLYNIID